MESKNNIIKTLKGYNEYFFLVFIFFVSALIFKITGLFLHEFAHLMDVATYLTWHNLFEFTGILVSFAVFIVSYYAYDQTKNLRAIFLGSVFLVVGIIDAFHTLSFKGMPAFFIPNSEANRATTLWIISRVITCIGFVAASFIPFQKKTLLRKILFTAPAVAISLFFFILVTYFPAVLPQMYIEGYGLTDLKKNMEYFIIILFVISIVMYIREYHKTRDFLTVQLAGALLLSIFAEIAFVSYKDVYNIYNYLGHVYKFISFFIIFRVMFVNSVKKPYVELALARNEIQEYAENLDRLVDKRTEHIMRMNQKLLDDLEYARNIQKAILPSSLPRETGVSFSASYFPAERVSGDFYNVFRLDDDNIGLYIGDVAGHGVSAAMLMVFINQSIKTCKEVEHGRTEIFPPSKVLRNLYESFNNTNFKDDIYVVLFYAVYNIKNKELTYSSAGLNTPPLIVSTSGEIKELSIQGFPICKFIEYYDAVYDDATLKLKSGDKVLFYTDGLVDAENKTGEIFSDERLMAVLQEIRGVDCSSLANMLEKRVFGFIDDNVLKDDITFFIMEVE